MDHQPIDSQDSNDKSNRKRVGKACDRCRLKKSKCDGSKPCSRCRADNYPCNYGDRKRAPDKVHPKGYPELLERDREKLMNGMYLLYDLHLRSGTWPGKPLQIDQGGKPLVHDILERLGVLEAEDGSPEPFEEDLTQLREELIRNQAGQMDMERRFSTDSGSDSSSPSSHSGSSLDTPPQRLSPTSAHSVSSFSSQSSLSPIQMITPDSFATATLKPDLTIPPFVMNGNWNYLAGSTDAAPALTPEGMAPNFLPWSITDDPMMESTYMDDFVVPDNDLQWAEAMAS